VLRDLGIFLSMTLPSRPFTLTYSSHAERHADPTNKHEHHAPTNVTTLNAPSLNLPLNSLHLPPRRDTTRRPEMNERPRLLQVSRLLSRHLHATQRSHVHRGRSLQVRRTVLICVRMILQCHKRVRVLRSRRQIAHDALSEVAPCSGSRLGRDRLIAILHRECCVCGLRRLWLRLWLRWRGGMLELSTELSLDGGFHVRAAVDLSIVWLHCSGRVWRHRCALRLRIVVTGGLELRRSGFLDGLTGGRIGMRRSMRHLGSGSRRVVSIGTRKHLLLVLRRCLLNGRCGRCRGREAGRSGLRGNVALDVVK